MSDKIVAEIITDFVMRFSGDKNYTDFFAYNDLGLPLAVAFNANLCELTTKGEEVLDETWSLLCEKLDAPANGDYDDLDDLLRNQNTGN